MTRNSMVARLAAVQTCAKVNIVSQLRIFWFLNVMIGEELEAFVAKNGGLERFSRIIYVGE